MSPPAPTERGEATRRRIIETAVHLFTERGFDATPVSAIIDAAGVTKGGFYFHFPSKSALGLEAIDAMRDEQRDRIVTAVGTHPRAIDQLLAMAKVAATTEDTSTGAALGRMCLEMRDDPVTPPLDQAFEEWFVLVGELVARAQAEGDADPSIDPRVAGFMIVATFLGIDYVEQIRESPEGVAAHLDDYVRYALRGAGIRHPDDDVTSPTPPTTVSQKDSRP